MKLKNDLETENQEFKTSLSELDKGLLSLATMLNKDGYGKIYFGIANDGTIIGLNTTIGEETIEKISTRISELIKPTIIPKIFLERYENLIYIVVEASGFNKPYSCGGNYRIMVGIENKKIDPSTLIEIVLSNSMTLMENIESIDQNLTFE